ncbi:hypothetical protein GQ53DRAFT_787382 [Thozetella sp. PMI_491]|nr:hypothetical protein GQ53DRAFT_787382 [Thozetella sp. PMI_491]
MLLVALVAVTHKVIFVPKTAAEIEAQDWNYCGHTSEVAKQRGCVMEPLYYGWFPPQCVFSDLIDLFPVFEDRKWYRDVNLTVPLSPEQLWNGQVSPIYTSRYHSEHCLYQWRKLQYAVDHRTEFVDNKTISYGHENHCANQMSVRCEDPTDITEINLGFYKCRKSIW